MCTHRQTDRRQSIQTYTKSAHAHTQLTDVCACAGQTMEYTDDIKIYVPAAKSWLLGLYPPGDYSGGGGASSSPS